MNKEARSNIICMDPLSWYMVEIITKSGIKFRCILYNIYIIKYLQLIIKTYIYIYIQLAVIIFIYRSGGLTSNSHLGWIVSVGWFDRRLNFSTFYFQKYKILKKGWFIKRYSYILFPKPKVDFQKISFILFHR